MISSLANPQVKRVRRLQTSKRFRSQEQIFIIEGTRMIQELAAGAAWPEALYCTRDWLSDPVHERILAEANLSSTLVTNEVMAAMSSTETAPGILAAVPMNPRPLPEEPELILILDALTNPGNLGSVLRTAGAAPVDAVLLAPGCVDIYNPKVVRGAMGAHFRLPFRSLTWQEIKDYCRSTAVWLSMAAGDLVYTDVSWRQPSALIIGNEAQGAGVEAQKAAQGSVYIPMARATESLNAATAAAVILFEAARQRKFPLYAQSETHH